MQIQRVFLLCLHDPLAVEPVLRMLRIAVEPEPRACHRAARHRLLHKGTRHERHLVKEHARQRDALDQRRGGFVLAAEQIKAVLGSAVAHQQTVLAQLFFTHKAETLEQGQQRRHHIAPQRTDGFAAHAEVAAAERIEAPQHERQRQAKGLAAAHRAVADDRVAGAVGRLPVPPAQRTQLLGRESLNHPPRLRLPWRPCRSLPSVRQHRRCPPLRPRRAFRAHANGQKI